VLFSDKKMQTHIETQSTEQTLSSSNLFSTYFWVYFNCYNKQTRQSRISM